MSRRADAAYNDLAALHPDLAAEWHPTRSSDSPDDSPDRSIDSGSLDSPS